MHVASQSLERIGGDGGSSRRVGGWESGFNVVNGRVREQREQSIPHLPQIE